MRNRRTHSKVECELHVPLVNIVIETSLLVGLEAVGQGRSGHGRHKGGQKADNQGCEAHCEQGGAEQEELRPQVWDYASGGNGERVRRQRNQTN